MQKPYENLKLHATFSRFYMITKMKQISITCTLVVIMQIKPSLFQLEETESFAVTYKSVKSKKVKNFLSILRLLLSYHL